MPVAVGVGAAGPALLTVPTAAPVGIAVAKVDSSSVFGESSATPLLLRHTAETESPQIVHPHVHVSAECPRWT